MYKNRIFFEKVCKHCIKNYQIIGSSRIISSLIYQCCRKLDMDVAAVEGLLIVEVNGYKRQYAHCFNIYHSNIVDACVYQFALMNKVIANLFPFYIVGSMPEHIEYTVMHEIKYETQMKFSDDVIENIIKMIKEGDNLTIERFSEIEDSKKKNLFLNMKKV